MIFKIDAGRADAGGHNADGLIFDGTRSRVASMKLPALDALKEGQRLVIRMLIGKDTVKQSVELRIGRRHVIYSNALRPGATRRECKGGRDDCEKNKEPAHIGIR
jgi:hypothetical protein